MLTRACHQDPNPIDANLGVSVSHAYEVKRIGLGRGEGVWRPGSFSRRPIAHFA
jgi:hypothetical protein